MNYLLNNPLNATDPTGYMRRRPNNRERGKDPTGGGVNWDYFEFVPSIFDQIDESVKRRSAKYSALTYEELQELKKRDKEEADKAKQAKENANKKDDKSGKYNPTGMPFNLHLKGGMMNDGIQMDKEDGSAGGGDASTWLTSGSMLMGATGYRIGSHMSSVSRFGPLYWNNGAVYRPALKGYRFGPLSGEFATKLGAGLRMGGNILGGFGIAYTGYQMYHGNMSIGEGSLDIGFGVVGFFGTGGLFFSGGYIGTKVIINQYQNLSPEQDYPQRYMPGKL